MTRLRLSSYDIGDHLRKAWAPQIKHFKSLMMNCRSLGRGPPGVLLPDRQSVFKWSFFFLLVKCLLGWSHHQVILHYWNQWEQTGYKTTTSEASHFCHCTPGGKSMGHSLGVGSRSPAWDKPISIMTKLNTAIYLKSGLARKLTISSPS